MDIEGFEARAVKGSHKLFQKLDVRGIIMEWLFHKGTETAVTIIQFMEDNNYKPYPCDFEDETPKCYEQYTLACRCFVVT